jgi:hypothetical protein
MGRLMARVERAERRALPNPAVHVVSVPAAQYQDEAVIAAALAEKGISPAPRDLVILLKDFS